MRVTNEQACARRKGLPRGIRPTTNNKCKATDQKKQVAAFLSTVRGSQRPVF